MKSLAHLLSGTEEISSTETDIDICGTDVPVKLPSVPSLPTPLTFNELYQRHCHSVDSHVEDLPRLLSVRLDLKNALNLPSVRSTNNEVWPTINLLDYASHFCPGVDLQAELANGGSGGVGVRRRRRVIDDMESTIQHKRRRKGQASDIIQTGRSSKKYGEFRSKI